MPILVKIEGQIQVQSWRSRSGWWVANCEQLQLTACGETYLEMQQDLDENIQDLLRYLVKEGKLEEYLSTHGWSLIAPDGVQVNQQSRARFDVPWELAIGRPGDLVNA